MSRKKRNLRAVFAQPFWNRWNISWGVPYHAGRKSSKEYDDERKAQRGQLK